MINKLESRLNKYTNFEKNVSNSIEEYTLDNIKFILNKLNNPQEKIKLIHIAGTNGKGSVANILNSFLLLNNYKTGLFTSPHLLKVNERIKINGINIENNIFLEYINIIEKILENHKDIVITYFELLTIVAFLFFKDNKVDIAIIETGLGGRLDSTNVITPILSIITDISYDHQSILGNTLSEITTEKCGIIKRKIPVITSNTNNEILTIIKKECKLKESQLYCYDKDFFAKNIINNIDGFTFNYIFNKENISNILINLFGKFQIKNFSSALTALFLLKNINFKFDFDKIVQNSNKIKIPGRFEILCKDPLIIFDPAHNEMSIVSLIQTIKEKFPGKNIKPVISFMIDKEPEKNINYIKSQITDDIIYIHLKDNRCFKPNNNVLEEKDIKVLFDIISKNKNDIYLFTGTFRLFFIADEISGKYKGKI